MTASGDRAEKDSEDEDIQVQLELEMRQLMEVSGQRKFVGHKSLPTDKGLWKFGRLHISSDVKHVTYLCLTRMRNCNIVAIANTVSEL